MKVNLVLMVAVFSILIIGGCTPQSAPTPAPAITPTPVSVPTSNLSAKASQLFSEKYFVNLWKK